ncbi:MAG: hypothetical protein JWR69_867 [Pedosphaera sp.]|nr:hypothetical protein [Pedosphaera sp.]
MVLAQTDPAQEPNPAPGPPNAARRVRTISGMPEVVKPKEEPKYEWREFSVRDLRDLQFDAWDGAISFTLNGETYTFQPRIDEKTTAPNEVVAGAAVLTQLRIAERLRIPVLTDETGQKRHIIARWILKFADAK